MYLESLKLINFKNIVDRSFNFSKCINCFVGNNGVGKTNVLDSINYLSLTKSFLNNKDQINILHDEDFFFIEGIFNNLDREDIINIHVKSGQKKIVKKNHKAYSRMYEHVGKYPSVMISPYDQNLISESSDFRRKFINNIIGQINLDYLNSVIIYQKTLAQRNSILKQFVKNNYFDSLSLEIYDDKLESNAKKIYQERKKFIDRFLPIFCNYYNMISSSKEKPDILYKSDLERENFSDLLKNNLNNDRISGSTTKGVHKDDVIFNLNGYPIKKYASQGQQKSFLIALKLSQMHIIKEETDIQPMLLMDDIFDKLDDERVKNLINLVHDNEIGQIFITDTNKERTEKIVKQISEDYKIIEF